MNVPQFLITIAAGVVLGGWALARILALSARRDPIGHMHRLYGRMYAGKAIIFAPWPGTAFPRAEPPFPPCGECGGSKFPCVGCGGDHCPTCEVKVSHAAD
jgi:hypothetical protein